MLFLKGQGHQGIFFWVKGILLGNVYCSIPRAPMQGHQCNDQEAWKQLPSAGTIITSYVWHVEKHEQLDHLLHHIHEALK